MRVTHNKAGTQTRPQCRGPGYGMRLPPRVRIRTNVYAVVCVHTRRRKGGVGRRGCLAQRARGAPAQKVHCIYKSFIMNYTMVYLKWEACLVHGYMGYRDYNACGGGRDRGERDPRLQEAADSRATARYRVGVRLRAYALPALTHTWSRVHTRLQIDIAGRMPAPE